MRFELVKEVDIGTFVRPNTEYIDDAGPLSSYGKVAKELGIAKGSGELTTEERKLRVLGNANQISLTNVDYAAPNGVAYNKIYPEGDNTMNAFAKMVEKSFTTNSSDILSDPRRVACEFVEYTKFCGLQKVPMSIAGVSTWLGITRQRFNVVKNSESETGDVLQKIASMIGQLRTLHADEGKIPVVQHIFEMANNHGYTRSDPKAALNIEINNTGFSTSEQMSIIDAEEY